MTKLFGRTAEARPPFQINDRVFDAALLSLAEEKRLAQSAAGPEEQVLDDLLETLATILSARCPEEAPPVTSAWLMDNLTTADLEAIVEYLRRGEMD